MRVCALSPQGPWTQDYVISTIIRTNKRKEKVTTTCTVVVNQVECPQAKSQLLIFQTILLQIQTPAVLTIKERQGNGEENQSKSRSCLGSL